MEVIMHDHHIEGMVQRLKPVLKDPLKARVILKRYWRTRMALVWEVGDVYRAANERKRAVTESEACSILQTLHQQHNAQCGIQWNDLWGHIDLYQPGRPLTEAELKSFVERDLVTVQK
jgi:hypothetical protein